MKLVIYGSNGYLLEKDGSGNLCLLSSPVLRNVDFMEVALQLLNKVASY